MKFRVLKLTSKLPKVGTSKAYLQEDNWDDWFKYSTLYSLVVDDAMSRRHIVGGVKVGQFNMKSDQRRPSLPEEFETLDDSYFSVGQDSSYYETLNELSDNERDAIFASLRDLAAAPELFNKAKSEEVTKTSLLRSVSRVAVQHQFHRLTQGGARLTEYDFSYTAPRSKRNDDRRLQLDFSVEPESQPPTNIHVLIGRNGVGKTYMLSNMTSAIASQARKRNVGRFSSRDSVSDEDVFANLVSVTFSAFDLFIPMDDRREEGEGIRYAYVGLKRSGNAGPHAGKPKSPAMLAKEFVSSVRTCVQGARLRRWRDALETLEADPIFKEAEVHD